MVSLIIGCDQKQQTIERKAKLHGEYGTNTIINSEIILWNSTTTANSIRLIKVRTFFLCRLLLLLM